MYYILPSTPSTGLTLTFRQVVMYYIPPPFNCPTLFGNAVWTELMYFGRETHYNNFGIGDDEQLMITEF